MLFGKTREQPLKFHDKNWDDKCTTRNTADVDWLFHVTTDTKTGCQGYVAMTFGHTVTSHRDSDGGTRDSTPIVGTAHYMHRQVSIQQYSAVQSSQ